MTSRRPIETLDDLCESLSDPGTLAVPPFDPETKPMRRRPRDGEPAPEEVRATVTLNGRHRHNTETTTKGNSIT